jgi:hypothetical protein
VIAATDAIYARLGAPAGASHAADIADLPTVAELASGLAALNDLSSVEAQAAADAALSAAISEPANLAATKSTKNILYWMFSRFFHRNNQTSTQQKTFKADGTTVLATRTVSDDATTQELGAGS